MRHCSKVRASWLVVLLALATLVACGDVSSSQPDAASNIDAAASAPDAAPDANTDVTVMVARSGAGAGTVTSAPAGIDCGATCSGAFALGSTVTLTASPAAGSVVASWGGACASASGDTCTLTVTADAEVAIVFELAQHTVTITPGGNGMGRVTSVPAGLDCGDGGTSCSATFTEGTAITLTAAPSVGSLFGGWGGGTCSGMGPCTFTLAGAVAVDAPFQLDSFTLLVSKSGTGAGASVVTSTPAGIDCGATCATSFLFGTSVTLTAVPTGDVVFDGWTGACTGTGACTVAMTSSQMVGAVFTLRRYPLTVTRAGTGAGTVTSAPNGINCGADCDETYDSGTSVVLTATAAVGSTFAGWTGACTGTGTCLVTLTAARSVTATFIPTLITVTVARTGVNATGAVVTSSPAGITCGATCSGSFPIGTTLTLTQAPGGGIFDGWSGPCSGVGTCTFTVTAPTTATAAYRGARVALNASATSCLRGPTNVLARVTTLLQGRGHTVSLVTGGELDTAAEINAFDVLVLQGPGAGCSMQDFATFDPVVDQFVRTNGRGVVATGWFLFTNFNAPQLVGVLPSTRVGNFLSGAQTVAITGGHPITSGLAGFTTNQWLPWGGGPRPGATPLLTVGTTTVAEAWSVDAGRAVYAGPMYVEDYAAYDNESLLDGSQATAVEFFLRSVEWAAKAR